MNIKKFIVHLLEVDLQAETSTINEAKNQTEASLIKASTTINKIR